MTTPTLAGDLLKAEKNLAVLLEVLIKRRLDTETWTLTAGQAYTYELAGTLCHLVGVREYMLATKAETPYTPKTSIAEVEAEVSTYWYDEANAILYVHTSTGADPGGGDFLTKATAWRYFSNGQAFGSEALIFNGYFYESRISEIPDVSSALRQLSEGGIERTWGTIKILNGDGAYDAELGEWIWQMCIYVLRVGVPGAAYSDYAIIARGRTGTMIWTDDDFSLACEDQMLAEDGD